MCMFSTKHPDFTTFRPVSLAAGLLAALVLLASCTSSPDRYRGSLSDAMDKARDDNEGSRAVPDYPYPERDDPPLLPPPRRGSGKGIAVNPPSGDSPGEGEYSEPLVNLETVDGSLCFGFRGAEDLASSDPWEGFFDGDLLLGISTAPGEALLYVGLRGADPLPGTRVAESLDEGVGFLRAGFELRWFPFPERTWASPHLDFGFGGFYMGWTFRNPLIAGGETIEGDNIGGGILSVGAGVSLIRAKHFEAGIRIVPEVYFYDEITSEGFSNDFFDPYGVVKLSWEVLFR